MPSPISPFTKEHAVMVRDALRLVADAREKIALAEKCGAPCEQDKMIADELQKALEAYRDNFTEPQPPG